MTLTKAINEKNFIISTNQQLIDVHAVFQFLSTSYWANNRSYDEVQTSIRHSLCFGLYEGKKQVGFARILTDYITHAYIMDVYILPEYQGVGLGQWLMQNIIEYDQLAQVKSWILATKDAHEFYKKFGFNAVPYPERIMVKHKIG